jgi:hypothetical protein
LCLKEEITESGDRSKKEHFKPDGDVQPRSASG